MPPSLGGTNPKQVGLGMSLNSIDTLMTQGNAQSTGVVTDMMIQGDGFFRVAAPGGTFGGVGGNDLTAGGEQYTRAGNFSFDSQGYLVTTKGQYVLGTVAATGNIGRLQVDPATTAAINVDAAGGVTAVSAAGVTTPIGTLEPGQVLQRPGPRAPAATTSTAPRTTPARRSSAPRRRRPATARSCPARSR